MSVSSLDLSELLEIAKLYQYIELAQLTNFIQNLRNCPGKMSIFMALKGTSFGFYGTKSLKKQVQKYNIRNRLKLTELWLF